MVGGLVCCVKFGDICGVCVVDGSDEGWLRIIIWYCCGGVCES